MRYPFKAYKMKVDNHEFWVAECQVINGLIGQGDTLNEAIEELVSNETYWLEIAPDYNYPIPDIPVVRECLQSGTSGCCNS